MEKQDKIICHDCKKELQENEEVMTYHTTIHPERTYYKCKECHQKQPNLLNYQKVECYSRVTGYIRPVAQFNPGKQSEFHDRKTYKV